MDTVEEDTSWQKASTEKKLEELMVDANCLNLWEISFRSRAEFPTLLLLLAYNYLHYSFPYYVCSFLFSGIIQIIPFLKENGG